MCQLLVEQFWWYVVSLFARSQVSNLIVHIKVPNKHIAYIGHISQVCAVVQYVYASKLHIEKHNQMTKSNNIFLNIYEFV
jgi:hypothetical protein